ncbi:hypothetical protein F2P81_009725 [Scophthalmus maximus]|uniref:Uncharacterized protein n=1 Tax=Scophthalmus maximus TaxID=52904 RepID=A0A6A4T0R4_SCOMX|nr:hypothetical protein F2P81_009725 [Scophthalmus maximus]
MIIRSSDHPIISSSDHPIIPSSHHPVIPSSHHPIISSSDHRIIRSSGHPVIRSSHHPIIPSSHHPIIWLIPLRHMHCHGEGTHIEAVRSDALRERNRRVSERPTDQQKSAQINKETSRVLLRQFVS